MKYQSPVLINMKSIYGYANGACISGSANIEENSISGWGAAVTLNGGCGNGTANDISSGGATACADGSSNAYNGTGGTFEEIRSFCVSGNTVTTSLDSTYCKTGSSPNLTDEGYGCKEGSSADYGCFSGSSPTL